jgi:murein DD-endopeptidase MepM/ murein hydrolase activator NlpD
MNPSVDNLIRKYQSGFYPVVNFNPSTERLLEMDFTERNKDLTKDIIEDIDKFGAYIDSKLKNGNYKYGIGGYNELRTVYSRSAVFDAPNPGQEPRRLHLGTDIWGKVGTPVYAFMGGMIHSYGFNDQYGDYGATIILTHQLDALTFHTLYGHLSLRDIERLSSGQYITRGEVIGHFGEPEENGHWPPHLHIQLIQDMELCVGDYPGVCKFSERDKYLANCRDPDLILMMQKFL